MATKRVSQLTETTTPAAADYIPILQASTNQTKKVSVKNLVGIPDASWTAAGETWAYSSWDSTRRMGVLTVPTDATTKYTRKNRIRIVQATGGTKYGIIHDVTATTLTVHFPSGTTLTNEAITSPYYSPLDSPFGFPTAANSWLLSTVLAATSATTGNNAWQNTGGVALPLGIGDWQIKAAVSFQLNSAIEILTALSTSSTTASQNELANRDYNAARNYTYLHTHQYVKLSLPLAAAGSLYVLYKTGAGITYDARGDAATPHVTYIEALTNYL